MVCHVCVSHISKKGNTFSNIGTCYINTWPRQDDSRFAYLSKNERRVFTRHGARLAAFLTATLPSPVGRRRASWSQWLLLPRWANSYPFPYNGNRAPFPYASSRARGFTRATLGFSQYREATCVRACLHACVRRVLRTCVRRGERETAEHRSTLHALPFSAGIKTSLSLQLELLAATLFLRASH